MVFFVKQKTAYEMRISDWSSDVCSSDLLMPLSDAANVGFVYVSDRMAGDLPRIMQRLSDATGIEDLVAACGYSVAAGPTEYCDEIGRASGRGRVCQYVLSSVVAVSVKKKEKTNHYEYSDIIIIQP